MKLFSETCCDKEVTFFKIPASLASWRIYQYLHIWHKIITGPWCYLHWDIELLSYLFAEEPHLKSTILCFVSFLWPGVRREGGLWPASMHVSKHELDGRNGHVPEALFNTWATLPLVPLTYMVYRVALTTLDVVGRIPCKWLRHKKGVWLHGGFTLQMVVLQIRKQEEV